MVGDARRASVGQSARVSSDYVRNFGSDLLAEFEDGESLGVVHATMIRPFSEADEAGNFENGEFWGLLEFQSNLGDAAIERLSRQDLVRLKSDPDDPMLRLPVPTLVVEPVLDVRGDRPRWLVYEVPE